MGVWLSLFLTWRAAIPAECQVVAKRLLDPKTQKFREVIATDDLIRLSACLESPEPAYELSELLASGAYTERAASLCAAQVYLAPDQIEALRDLCDPADEQCAPILAVRKRHPLPETHCPGLKALPGGIFFGLVLGHVRTKGHYDITRDAKPAEFSRERWELAADAAQDPDFYEFGTPAAHAQTKNDPKTALLLGGDDQEAFVSWTQDKLQRSLRACARGKGADALYWLGYSLHAIQDLAFHEGISNAEHSFLDYNHSVGVDWKENFPAKLRTATELTRKFLSSVHEQMAQRDARCWALMTSTSTKRSSKRDLVGRWDFGFGAWQAYKGLGRIVDKAMAPCHERPGPHCRAPAQLFLSTIPDRFVPSVELAEHRWLDGVANDGKGEAFLKRILTPAEPRAASPSPAFTP